MKSLTFPILFLLGAVLFVSSCKDDNEPCIATTWYQDADNDGLGNPDVTFEACEAPTGYVANADDNDDLCGGTVDVCGVCDGSGETTWYEDADGDGLGNPDVSQSSCDQPNGYVADNSDPNDYVVVGTPLSAFDEFNSDAVTISFDGDEVTIVSNGLPNHTSPYWEESHPLHIEQVVGDHKTPGFIGERSYTVTLPLYPELASSSSATGLGAIGIAVSGPPIFNDEEGPNRPFDEPTATGLDYAGAHNGPSGYHYHLESADVPENTTLSHDDEQLVGIMADGFLLYGRKEMDGTYPTDLDESGGHFGTTPHSNGEEIYHYHIINEFYISSYIMLFGGDLQGTPNTIL